MEQRPKINIPLTTTDKALELVAILTLLSLWIYTIYSYNKLPDIIPVHYNLNGEIDR